MQFVTSRIIERALHGGSSPVQRRCFPGVMHLFSARLMTNPKSQPTGATATVALGLEEGSNKRPHRHAAAAERDLDRVRQVRAGWIGKVSSLGNLEAPKPLSRRDELRRIKGEEITATKVPLPAMPTADAERIAEAVRRILPELLRIDRYQRRAAARRDKAIRKISEHRKE